MELSILIPSRNEMFLAETVTDIVQHRVADTEVIVLLDGAHSDPPVPQFPNVNVIYVNKSVGQRAGSNLACRIAKGKYVMKVDAHCSFDEGFDRKMLDFFKEVGDDVTAVPIMRNLWAFDWKCMSCGKRTYQGPTPTKPCEGVKRDGTVCGAINYKRRMVWEGKRNPQSTSYCFDTEPHFQYFEDWKHREPYITDKKERGYTETMSLQGSAFMLTREKYWSLKICDEEMGNWGNQGIEVACKTWLSGGRVLVNHNTWYAHMFRTQGGDFSFPWQISNKDVQKTKLNVKNAIWKGFEGQVRPLSWLIEKFWPVPGWDEAVLNALKETEKPKYQ